MARTFDSALLTGWVRAATQGLERQRAEIDRINVFPIADGDTGTNLLLTMRSAAEAARRGEDRTPAAVAKALAHGALLGARGNSGVILSQVLRGVADAVAAALGPSTGGAVLADALRRAHRFATAAVSRPRHGTVLTVLAAAAAAAAQVASERLDEVAVAAADAARAALDATTGQLAELSRAGVVDAGGMGLCVVLDALATLATGRPVAVAVRGTDVAPGPEVRPSAMDHEVMYLLDGTDPVRVDALRSALDGLGDSVAVVDDGASVWNVHVHCTDVGAAIEAGIAAGRPHRIAVVRFADQVAAPDRFTRARAVVMVVSGHAIAELARSAGAVVVEVPVAEADLVAALRATGARHVVVLPDDPEVTPVAERAAAVVRPEGQDVVLVPTASVLQGLAALAVHDPERRPADDVVAMADAAAGTRTAALMVAETEALTWVGRCEPGDVLGIADGEVVLIAPDLVVGGVWLAHRMLLAGGEILTVLLGDGADPALGEGLAADLARSHPEVDVVIHRGGRSDYPIVLGVE